MTPRNWTMTLLLTALGALGCAAPEHLGDGYGRSFDTTLSRQAIRPPEKAAQPVTGLDSQEAAIISDGYRRSLASKGASPEDDSMVYVAPQTNGSNGRATLPPPSVPPNGK